MDTQTTLLLLAVVFGFYMAWNIGANDVANAIGTSVGSGALTLRRAVIIAAIFECSGAILAGSSVTETVQKGLVDPEIFAGQPFVFVLGMLAALLAAGIWLQTASYFGWPVSTSHSIVGSVVGFGLALGGIQAVEWEHLSLIASSWVLSPLLGGAIAYIVFQFLRRRIFFNPRPVEATKKTAPLLVFLVLVVLSLGTLFKGLKNLHLDFTFGQALLLGMGVGLLGALSSYYFLRKIKAEPEKTSKEGPFKNPEVLISLRKAVKHFGRVRNLSTGSFRDEAQEIHGNAKKLLRNAQKEVQPSYCGEYQSVEKIFAYLQIFSACFMAFAHGANDVANAIGPLAAIYTVIETGSISASATVPFWILCLGGVGIVVGLATWGWRIVETIGRKITELTPSRGFAAEFGAATTILLGSRLGLPISTTHTLVGAVLGVGFARGISALNLNTIRDIVLSWIITIPASAGMAVLVFYILRAVFV